VDIAEDDLKALDAIALVEDVLRGSPIRKAASAFLSQNLLGERFGERSCVRSLG
jgi:hypothetical protein